MKKLFFFLSFTIAFSCTKKAKEQNDVKKVHAVTQENKSDSILTIIGNVSPNDDGCIGEIERAKWDLEKNRLTYYVWKEPITYGRYSDELKELLEPLGVKCEMLSGLGNCIPLVNSRPGCYFEYMNAGIKHKFKKGLIDSLETQAMKTYIAKNIDNVIAYIDIVSEAKFYSKSKTYKTQREDIQRDFMKGFVYPKNFNKNNPWKASFGFIIHRNGSIKTPYIDIKFGNKNDKQFEEYFKKEIGNFIIKSKWTIYQIEDLKLDSEVHLTITNNNKYFEQNKVN